MSVAPTTAEEPTAAARAGGSSFYLAMRILPRAQREAMFEIYSFCRRVDDIADEGGPREERKRALAAWRHDIEALYAGGRVVGLDGLARAIEQFGLRKEDFLAVIDGMEMDAIEDIRAPEWVKLDLYCDRVASAVGRLSVRVFGLREQAGIDLAHHLGRALQLTNIARDIDEDADIGRLYLPREALNAAGIAATDPHEAVASPRIGEVCAAVLERARNHFARADAIMAAAPRKAVKAPRIMGEAYRAIFEGLEKRGFAPPRARVGISKPKLLLAILKYAFV